VTRRRRPREKLIVNGGEGGGHGGSG
jgi:hypothetical protein